MAIQPPVIGQKISAQGKSVFTGEPITGHQNLYQPTISETHAMGIELTNNNNKLPLEPDFSNMSDPDVVIACRTTNGDRTTDFADFPLWTYSRGISLEININLRKGGDIDRSLHSPPLNQHLQTFTEKQKV